MLPLASPPATAWQQSWWRDEPSWSSTQGPILAVVTELRARLIYLGSLDGRCNLLNAPYPHVLPDVHNPWPNQGGHRFWLGPQKRWVWPPPTEWEYAPAAEVRVSEHVLTLRQPRLDSSYPAIVREYGWDGARLRCTVRWGDHGQPYFGMHVVAVDLPFVGRAQLEMSREAPLGLVQVNLDGTSNEDFLPHPSVRCTEREAVLVGGVRVIKLGFARQPLTIERPGGWRLSVLPGPHQGIADGAPDRNYLSQIWVGGPEHDLAELEQLTPFLRGDESGQCASTIFFSAVPPGSG